ncbi:DUF1045 domain-containing protein [Amaricoccus sp.]|uniref:DUF1045 domain-containing protein n=1 Tax=Amaricoccus sp. TaxID=1872485 RepID=UPI001B6959F7|nr:DUF1045 domain-containing protein [Amaricoccus sp.]MBP7001368.1 DUF1045 domain-containing protein [Amaricoccus sp.]
MEGWRRFAVYYAPRAESAIARFGAAWLGWDAERGEATAGLAVPGLPAPREALVAAPARYGFHATLKAPFRLGERATAAGLDAALAALAGGIAAFAVPVRLGGLGGAAAIVPLRRSPALDRAASLCVRRLDGFRAALTAEEIARRAPGRLTPRQRRRLAAWGYPFVLEDFRFHLTLTGALPEAEREATTRALAAVVGPLLEAPLPVEDLCLFGEGADGRFRLLSRHPLLG